MEWVDFAYKALGAGSIIGTAVTAYLILRIRVEFATRSDVVFLTERVSRAEREIETINAAREFAPDQADIHRLELGLEKLSGQIGVFAERLEGFDRVVARAERVVERQETYLLRNAGANP